MPAKYGLGTEKKKSGLRWLCLPFMLLLGIGSMALATQRIAAFFSYHPTLSEPCGVVWGIPWYAPWSVGKLPIMGKALACIHGRKESTRLDRFLESRKNWLWAISAPSWILPQKITLPKAWAQTGRKPPVFALNFRPGGEKAGVIDPKIKKNMLLFPEVTLQFRLFL